MLKNRITSIVEKALLRQIANGKVNVCFPPFQLPKARVSLAGETISKFEFVNLIEHAPLVTASLFRDFHLRTHTVSLDEIYKTAGPKKLKPHLAALLPAASPPEPRNASIQDAYAGLWDHCIAVAEIARDLMALASDQPRASEIAYTMGLLHDIGKVLVGPALVEVEKALCPSSTSPWLSYQEWVEVVDELHVRIGTMLAQEWHLPKELQELIGAPNAEIDPQDRRSPSNFVRLANGLAKQYGLSVGTPKQSDYLHILFRGRSLLGSQADLMVDVCRNVGSRIMQRNLQKLL